MLNLKQLKSRLQKDFEKPVMRKDQHDGDARTGQILKGLLSSPGRIFNAPVHVLIIVGSGLFASIFAATYSIALFSGPMSPMRPRPRIDALVPSDEELRRKAVNADLEIERKKRQEALERRNKARTEYSALLAEIDSVQPLLDEAIKDINTRALDQFAARQAKLAAEAQKKREKELQEKSSKKESNRRLLVCITAERNFQGAMAQGDSEKMSIYDGIVKQNCN